MNSFASILGLKPITEDSFGKEAAVVAMTGKHAHLTSHAVNKYTVGVISSIKVLIRSQQGKIILYPSLQQKLFLELRTSTKELHKIVIASADSTHKAKIQATFVQEKFSGAIKILCRQNYYGHLPTLSIASNTLPSAFNTFVQLSKASKCVNSIQDSGSAIDPVLHHEQNLNSLPSASLTEVTDSADQATANIIQNIFSPCTDQKQIWKVSDCADGVAASSHASSNDSTTNNGVVKATTESICDNSNSEKNLGTTMNIIDNDQSEEPHKAIDAAAVCFPVTSDSQFDELDFINLYASDGESSESSKYSSSISSGNISEDETTNRTSPSASNSPKESRQGYVGIGVKHLPDSVACKPFNWNQAPPESAKEHRAISHSEMTISFGLSKRKETAAAQMYEVQGYGTNAKLVVVPLPKRASKFAGIFAERRKMQNATSPQQGRKSAAPGNSLRSIQSPKFKPSKFTNHFDEQQKQQDAGRKKQDSKIGSPDVPHSTQKRQNTPPTPTIIKRTRRVSIASLLHPASEAPGPSNAHLRKPTGVPIESLLCPSAEDYDENDHLQVLPETPKAQTYFFTPSAFVFFPEDQATIAADISPGLIYTSKEKFDATNDTFTTRVTQPGGYGRPDFYARLSECTLNWNKGKSWIDWKQGPGTQVQLPPERPFFQCTHLEYGTGLEQPPLAISPLRTPSTLRIKENKAPVLHHALQSPPLRNTEVTQPVLPWTHGGIPPPGLGYHLRSPATTTNVQHTKALKAARASLQWTDKDIPAPGFEYSSRSSTRVFYTQQTATPGAPRPAYPRDHFTTAAPTPEARPPGYPWNPPQQAEPRREAPLPPQPRNPPAPPPPQPETRPRVWPSNAPQSPPPLANSLHPQLLRPHVQTGPPVRTKFQGGGGGVVPALTIPQVEGPPGAVQVQGTLIGQVSGFEETKGALRDVPLEKLCCGGWVYVSIV